MTKLIKIAAPLILFCSMLFQVTHALEGISDASQIPAENFFKEDTDFSYRISPDGKQLAFIRKYTQTYDIVITDLEKFVEVKDFPVSKNIPQQLTWISNSRLVFGLKGVIYSINHDGSDLNVLISNIYDKDKVKSYSSLKKNLRYWKLLKRPKGNEEEVLFLSYNSDMYANVHKINIFTGEKTDLYDAKTLKANGLFTNRDGKVVLVERKNKESHNFFHLLNDDDLKLASVDISGKGYQLDYSAKSYLQRLVVVNGLGYEDNVIYLSERTSGDRYQLVKYNYATQQTEVIAKDPLYDVGNPDDEVSLYFDDTLRTLIGYGYERDKYTSVWLDARFQKYQQILDKYYPDKINRIYDWNENADKLLVYSYDAKSKGKIIVYDTINNKRIVQTDYSNLLSPAHMQDTEIYRYKSQDGATITSYLTPPAATIKNSKWPLIVKPHGGPFARSYYGYDEHMQFFSSRGYAVFKPNFRGSTGYGLQHLAAGKHQIADLMLSDIADGVNALIKENKVDPNQVYILGFSYGGYAAIMSAIKYPNLYSAAVSAAAPLDLIKQLKHYEKEKQWFAYEFWQEIMGVKTQNKKYIESISPLYRMEDIKIPLLVFHGDVDDVVPKEQAEDFKKMAEKKKINIPVRIIQSEGHGWSMVSSNVYFVTKSIELFQANKKSH